MWKTSPGCENQSLTWIFWVTDDEDWIGREGAPSGGLEIGDKNITEYGMHQNVDYIDVLLLSRDLTRIVQILLQGNFLHNTIWKPRYVPRSSDTIH